MSSEICPRFWIEFCQRFDRVSPTGNYPNGSGDYRKTTIPVLNSNERQKALAYMSAFQVAKATNSVSHKAIAGTGFEPATFGDIRDDDPSASMAGAFAAIKER